MKTIDDVKIALAVEILESKSLMIREKELEDRFKLNKRLKFVVKPSVFFWQKIVVVTVPGAPTRNSFIPVSEDIYREVVKLRRVDIHFKDLIEYKKLLEL